MGNETGASSADLRSRLQPLGACQPPVCVSRTWGLPCGFCVRRARAGKSRLLPIMRHPTVMIKLRRAYSSLSTHAKWTRQSVCSRMRRSGSVSVLRRELHVVDTMLSFSFSQQVTTGLSSVPSRSWGHRFFLVRHCLRSVRT